MKKRLLIVFSVFVMLFSLTACNEKEETSKYDKVINVNMEIKNYGTIEMELYPDLAPDTVDNFVSLIKEGFYDGLTFHRIIDGFMIQGGSSDGLGYTGSNKTIKGEFRANGFENDLKHERGVISMARMSGNYNSASSQFFIVQTTYPSLDGQYAAFGRVTSGMDIVDKICKDTPVEDNNGKVLPENQPVITNVYIVE